MLVWGTNTKFKDWPVPSGGVIRLYYSFRYFFPFGYQASNFRWILWFSGEDRAAELTRAEVEQLFAPEDAPHLNPLLRFGFVLSLLAWGCVAAIILVAKAIGA